MTAAPHPGAASSPTQPPPSDWKRRRTPAGVPYGLIVPALALYALIVLYPTVSGAVYAFTDWRGGAAGASFIGWDNFTRMFSDVAARAALANTVLIAVVVTAVQTALGLALALALNTALVARI